MKQFFLCLSAPKKLIFTMALLCALSMNAKTIFLDTGGEYLWGKDNATFFIHSWGSGDDDVQMTLVSGNIYSAPIPDGNSNLLFVRMPSGSTAINWNNYLNKSRDFIISSEENLCTVTFEGYNEKGFDIIFLNWSKSPYELVTFSEQGYENASAVTNYEGEMVSISFSGTASKYYDEEKAIRLESAGTFSINAKTGDITNIAFQFGANDGNNTISTNVGTYNESNHTWTGSSSSVSFTIGESTNNYRQLAGVIVTLNNGKAIPLKMDTISCAQALEIGNTMGDGGRSNRRYYIEGIVQNISSRTTNWDGSTTTFTTSFNIGDTKESANSFYVKDVTTPDYLVEGDKVLVQSYVYKSTVTQTYNAGVALEEKGPRSKITMRFNPYKVLWNDAYLYVWTDNSYYSYGNYVIIAQKAYLSEEDGWWTASFEMPPDVPFYVGWRYFVTKDPQYYSTDSFLESACFEYQSNSSLLKTVECTSVFPDENSSMTVHVATAGTFGELMVQKMGDLTWTDVEGLIVTGMMNDDDVQYLSRMTNLKKLDLSGTNITSIGGLNDKAKLMKVVLPTSCVSIKENAFQNCRCLISINLDNVQTIGNNAFKSCIFLTSANMPEVQTIGSYAFNGDGQLASAIMPKAATIESYAFANCTTLVHVEMPNITSLGANAFQNASQLENVILSDKLEVIPDYCFQNCPLLKSLTMPSSLKEIGTYAVPSVANSKLPEGLIKVANGNFAGTSINIPSTVTTWSSFSSNWKHVYCDIVVPPAFSVFNTSTVNKDTLHVPAVSLAAYKLHTNWYQFGKVIPSDEELSNLTINGEFTLLTTEGIAEKPNITLNRGSKLIVSAETDLAAGEYIQQISNPTIPYTGTLVANSVITADNVTIQYIPKPNQWNFFSLPFDVNMSDISICTLGTGKVGTSQWVIREYSGANRASGNGSTWNNVPADGVLKAHTGYILYWLVENSGNYDNNRTSSYYNFLYYFNMPAIKNANQQHIFANGDVNVPLTEYSSEFSQNISWNLVGNPYPSLFNIAQMDFNAPITTWNGTGYTAYSIEDDNYSLHPAEAFFVQAPKGTTNITFHKDGRANKSSTPKRLNAGNTRKVFNFILSNEDYSDRARLVLNDQASADYEITRDAAKMMSSDMAVPQLYVNDNGLRYAIDERPEASSYILGAFFGKAGDYTLHLNLPQSEDRQVLITDTETHITTDLTLGDYIFTTEAGTFESRFIITFAPKMPTEIDGVQGDNVQSTKYLENGQLIIVNPQGKKFTVGGTEL